jgi:hypothetical protein
MARASGLTGLWSPSERKSGSSGRDPDASLLSPAWTTDAASDAQHRAIGGNGRSAVIAERTCRIKPNEAITPAIWRAMEPIQAIRV